MHPALEIVNVSKSFNGVRALSEVSFSVSPGEIHGLVGGNGSGKSTLVKILGGLHTPEAGSVSLWGQQVALPLQRPQRYGIAIVHQDLGLVDDMTVWENIGVGVGYGRRLVSPFSRRREVQVASEIAARFGHHFDPDERIVNLSRAEQSIVAIVRAIRTLESHGSSHLIILDEPTAALPAEEADVLIRFMRELADHGSSVLFISHHLEEVVTTCDRVTVIRDGRLVCTEHAGEITSGSLLQRMVGHELAPMKVVTAADRTSRSDGQAALVVDDLSGAVVRHLSFAVAAGEIVGITGLTGMGYEEIPYLLMGAQARSSGRVVVNGTEVGPGLAAARASGMALVPANRVRDAIWTDGSATENVTLPVLGLLGRAFFLSHSKEKRLVENAMSEFDVRPRSTTLRTGAFSGGNQQKLVMAKWLQTHPVVLLLHAPTQGIDAKGRDEVLESTRLAAKRGAAIVLCSDDNEELIQACQRIIILRRGRISDTLESPYITPERLVELCQVAS